MNPIKAAIDAIGQLTGPRTFDATGTPYEDIVFALGTASKQLSAGDRAGAESTIATVEDWRPALRGLAVKFPEHARLFEDAATTQITSNFAALDDAAAARVLNALLFGVAHDAEAHGYPLTRKK